MSEEAAIRETMASYEAALNSSSTDAVARLYTEDGVFMPQDGQPAVGLSAVKEAYDAAFGAIALKVQFDFAEVVQMAPEWAYVRTTSSGTTTIKATGARVPEGNQELFLLRKEQDAWKIARYSFSERGPVPQS